MKKAKEQSKLQTRLYLCLYAHNNHKVFFFLTLATGPRRSLSLELSDTPVHEPQI